LTKKAEKEKPPQPLPSTDTSIGIANPPREGITTRIGSSSSGLLEEENHSLDNDSAAIVKGLLSKLENRLSVKENIQWSFRLGKSLGKLKAEIDNGEKMLTSISEINQLGADAPDGISKSVTSKIKELVELSQQTMPKAEEKQKLTTIIEDLRNLKTY
jgi:hypothetical protein